MATIIVDVRIVPVMAFVVDREGEKPTAVKIEACEEVSAALQVVRI